MKTAKLSKKDSITQSIQVQYCDTFWRKLLGLMFTRELQPDAGIILVENAESKFNTAIHMFFMNYDIAVLWLDKKFVVVDKILAKKWRPYYASKVAAQYVVEMHPSRLPDYMVGETLALTVENDEGCPDKHSPPSFH